MFDGHLLLQWRGREGWATDFDFWDVTDLYGWVARLATQPYKSFKIFAFSNYQKVSRLSNRGLKIGNLTNFIVLFPFLATILYSHLFLWLTWSHLVTWTLFCPPIQTPTEAPLTNSGGEWSRRDSETSASLCKPETFIYFIYESETLQFFKCEFETYVANSEVSNCFSILMRNEENWRKHEKKDMWLRFAIMPRNPIFTSARGEYYAEFLYSPLKIILMSNTIIKIK